MIHFDASTTLLSSLRMDLAAGLDGADPMRRLSAAADASESLARHDPAAFDQISAAALRWPTDFVSTVIADLSDGFANDPRSPSSGATPLSQSLHFLELWVEALRAAYTSTDASAHDRERARLALRCLRNDALTRCATAA